MNRKADLRKKIRALLLLPDNERPTRSAQICEMIVAMNAWTEARTVGLFAPQLTEPDVERLWNFATGQIFCYPRVTENGALDFFRVDDRARLTPGRWNLREPERALDAQVPLGKIDLLLVPGLAFTRDGHRLGRGGGYYDRLLSQKELHARTVGVCFQLQLLPALPVEPHDAKVDQVVFA